MNQPIAGVAPPDLAETTVMTVWPSVSAYPSGRFLGRCYSIKVFPYIFKVGNFLALASIPHALFLYFWRLAPLVGMRYRLTNRRLIVERGWMSVEEKSVDLDRYDTIDVVVRPGQEWFKAGDLIFRLGSVETFRLEGVSRPEPFREVCMKAGRGYVGVKESLAREAAGV